VGGKTHSDGNEIRLAPLNVENTLRPMTDNYSLNRAELQIAKSILFVLWIRHWISNLTKWFTAKPFHPLSLL